MPEKDHMADAKNNQIKTKSGATVDLVYDIMMIQGASLRVRSTPPATLAQEGKVHQTTMRSGQRSVIKHIFFNDCSCKLAT